MAVPVFIVGVPRSGTTLLRVILDSHPNLAVGPECPWISGNYGNIISFRHLLDSLTNHKLGPLKNFSGISEERIVEILRVAIDAILTSYAKEHNKRRWIEKTPDNITCIPFINKIFPDAKYIHIIRDGRDVASSSSSPLAKKNWGKYINYGDQKLENNTLNCLRRWDIWISQFQNWMTELNIDVFEVKYENLVNNPRKIIGEILSFIEEPWSDNVLYYTNFKHDLPNHEFSTPDILNRDMFSKESIGRWKSEFSLIEKLRYKKIAGNMLKKFGYLG